MAKIEDRILKGEDNQLSFSMLNYKVVSSNMRMLNLFIHKFDVDMSYEKMRIAYDDVPPTSNQSEQALRPNVIFRKVTNGFRSQKGKDIFSHNKKNTVAI
ncbi:MAG: transposase [Candidatus Sericytochromatia bacterium]|nr:transposase [Candidatus Sericytochromatia bacterium]